MAEIIWSNWKHRSISPWQGCLLSLGLNPDDYRASSDDSVIAPNRLKIDTGLFPSKAEHGEFIRRQSLITENRKLIADKDLSELNSNGQWKVTISAFARLALDLEIPLPPEFAAFASTPPPGQKKDKWPWGSYENEALRIADAAIRKWWINYDPADYTSAPTIGTVSGWIEKEFKLTNNKANLIATLINADGIKSGRR